MDTLIADSGSTKTKWALVTEQPGLPKIVQTVETEGLNPLYATQQQIADALSRVLRETQTPSPDRLQFYGSGCSGERVGLVEQALRSRLTPMTQVTVSSDLMGAAMALRTDDDAPFIACILGTGAIAALYEPDIQQLTPMPALGYILGDEGSGAWLGRHVLSDYLKGQMPQRAAEAFADDYGTVTAEQAIRHTYQQPFANRYLATFASFAGRHADMSYCQQLAYRGIDAFWQRNVMRIDVTEAGEGIRDVRLVGSVAWHLRAVIETVAASHGYLVTRVIKDPIAGLV